ncbi:hypothetical protein MAGR_64600 [Mycolicibacterium agri]|uniref:Uncharacterized protein n=1 Tax=Mycolicibacterium agri TaxID=36811 RepID=A0A7I9WC56_MYCAG|nr:hypothetical protein MAGR_64600 [Mycolicibacterium agri]
MNLLDDIGAGLVEDLVAALELIEVVEGEIRRLQLGAHGAVTHQDPLRQSVEEVSVISAGVRSSHIVRVVGLCKRPAGQRAFADRSWSTA